MTLLSYRPAIGIIVVNEQGQVLIARRNDMENQWQFPQGGIDPNEAPHEAVLRELKEETGIDQNSVEILGNTQTYLKYDYPPGVMQELNVKKSWRYAGQQVRFFLLRYFGLDEGIDVQNVAKPEFDAWKWVAYWEPLRLIVEFKRDMYDRALTELVPNLRFVVK
ncbi:MAG: RNA pyrophosphohydrolase [Gammaproteobacteria bacterium]|nr:RNA pyrophosphohydrolase [Gammaproteobacteria bacterium]MYC25286.1 RNA pyrophosphohydrolase [Gammaproteobacteria bacterium]